MANINPIKIFQKDNVKEEYYVFSGYVKSVTDQGTYNSVSFKANSEDSGIDAPLVSVRCFAQTIGVNHKKLVENAKADSSLFLLSKIFTMVKQIILQGI